jgi:RimJ/RimL family protein N-acetyltransferase
MSLPSGFDLRYSVQEDLGFLRQWLQEDDALHWFPFSLGKEMEDASQGWISFSRLQASLTAVIDEEPCAIGTLFLMPYRKVAHECMIQLVVGSKWRRNGVGSSLLKNLIHLAKTKFRLKIVYFELVEGNPIEPMLKKFDFRLAARQEGYFKEEERYFARLIYDKEI